MKTIKMMGIHNGLGELLVYFMLWCSTLDLIHVHWNHNRWNFSGLDGMVGLWSIMEGGKRSTSTRLDLLIAAILLLLDFSIHKRLFRAFISSQLSRMVKPLNYFLGVQLPEMRMKTMRTGMGTMFLYEFLSTILHYWLN